MASLTASTACATCREASSISSADVYRPTATLMHSYAESRSSPSAVRTCEGSGAPNGTSTPTQTLARLCSMTPQDTMLTGDVATIPVHRDAQSQRQRSLQARPTKHDLTINQMVRTLVIGSKRMGRNALSFGRTLRLCSTSVCPSLTRLGALSILHPGAWLGYSSRLVSRQTTPIRR